MQRRTLSVLAALAAALPLATQADTMDYSFVDLGYVDTELDDIDVDGDGFALRGSLAFHENFFAFAELEDLGFDFGVDVTQFNIGVGGHMPLNEKIDLVGRFGIVKADLEADRFGVEEDEDGFTLGARLRGQVMPRFELEGGFDYVDVDSGDDTSIVLEGRYFFMDTLSGGLRLAFGDADTIGVGMRLTF
jgi:Outer membrane protein beta-barrel domain